MNILTFTGLFPNHVFPNQGVFIMERIRALSKLEDVSLKVVAPIPYCPPFAVGRWGQYRRIAAAETIDGLDITHPRYVMIPKIGMSLYGLLLFLCVLPHLKRLQRQFDFDVIDAHFVYPDGFAAVLLGSVFHKPVVVSARGSDVNVYKRLHGMPPLLKYALNRAKHVVAVSHALGNAIASLDVSREHITVIPNGVDRTVFFPQSRETARKALGLPGSEKILLSVGHFTWNKGFDVVLRALKCVLEERADLPIRLVLLGDGTIRRELEAMTESLRLTQHVRFAGAVPNRELPLWYNAADAFCLASKDEGWPNVLMEAMACGTPVIATKAGGIPEIIHAPHLGLLSERTPEALAVAIRDALSREWDREVLAREVRRRGWDCVAQEVLEVLRSVTERGSRAVSPGLAKPMGTGELRGVL
ncbi:MAG: glycosyltransferase family 4 protein [Nitrospira sp.]|nr:glycosyltransferase family 4 protein [Nitrospira sp.]